MAGILANSTSVVMSPADTAPINVFEGFLTAERVTLSVDPAGTTFSWGISSPSSSTVRSELSSTTSATPVFTPDVGGFYVITCTVDSTIVYRLTLSVTQVAISTVVEASRYQPKTNASVTAPVLGRALFFSSDLGSLAAKAPDGSVEPLGIGGGTYLSQAVWHINAATGDDLNDGKTSGTALKTFAEWSNRIGDNVVTVATTVNLDSDLNEPGYSIRGSFPLGCTIAGQRTVLHSGVVSNVIQYDYTTSPVTAGSFEDATLTGASWSDSGPGGTSLVNKLVGLTSGAFSGTAGWVAKDNGAKVCRPTGTFIDALTYANGFPSNGDTFDVCDLTKIEGGPIWIHSSRAAGFLDGVSIRDCNIIGGAVDFGTAVIASSPYGIYDCSVGAVSHNTGGSSWLINCLAEPGSSTFQVQDGHLYIVGGINHTQLRSAGRDGQISLQYEVLSQYLAGIPNNLVFSASDTGQINVSTNGKLILADEQRVNAAAIKCEASAVVIIRGSIHTLNQGGVGFGVWIDAGGKCYWDDSPSPLASDHMDFDNPSVDVYVAGSPQTVAALAGVGAVNLTNLAACVPRERTP